MGFKAYTPVPLEDRKIGVNRPDHPEAVRFHTRWFLPLDVLPAVERVMPETRPDEDAYDHMSKLTGCRCDVCRRPQARRYQARWRRHQGLRG
jgi:hypothetical protein